LKDRLGDSAEDDIVQREGARDGTRSGGIEGDYLSFEPFGGRGMGEREAWKIERGAVSRDRQRGVARLPVRDLDGFGANSFEAEGAELLLKPVFGPAVGRVARSADAVGEDFFDPGEDPVFGGDEV